MDPGSTLFPRLLPAVISLHLWPGESYPPCDLPCFAGSLKNVPPGGSTDIISAQTQGTGENARTALSLLAAIDSLEVLKAG